VLQDRMFESATAVSVPAHMYLVSAWSAKCSNSDPASCVNDIVHPDNNLHTLVYSWTDMTYLLFKSGVSWKYYCYTSASCQPGTGHRFGPNYPNNWNPLIRFVTVVDDGQLGLIQDIANLCADAQRGTLPAVSWIIPRPGSSEHPNANVRFGEEYVTELVNLLMQGPEWESTAIFITWDDWGGFYDHVVPPIVDQNGYGLRVPGLLISPYALRGYIDHQTLSHDAYLKLIEDLYLDGQRLDPQTDGRPDPRISVREAAPQLGNLVNDFDFSQAPRAPLLLPTRSNVCSNPGSTRTAPDINFADNVDLDESTLPEFLRSGH
jgi:phospholipase C